MFKRIVSCLISLSILGYFVLHEVDHTQTNLSENGFHSQAHDHFPHNVLAADHQQHPFEIDHLHLDEFSKRPSKQKHLKDVPRLSPFHVIGNTVESANKDNFYQLANSTRGAFYLHNFDRINLPLRI